MNLAQIEELFRRLVDEQYADSTLGAPDSSETPAFRPVYRAAFRGLEVLGEVRERRAQLRHPNYQKPQLLATGSNQVWSWDITKLLGPVKWTYFYLYVILDIFSRYAVGWIVAERESA